MKTYTLWCLTKWAIWIPKATNHFPKISTETGEEPRADIVFSIRGEEKHASASGSGPVDAIFKAIESVAQSGATLQIYSVNAVTQGTESQGETSVRLQRGDRVVNGQGADTDVLVATAKAYLSALSNWNSVKLSLKHKAAAWFNLLNEK